jgi:hypothetical protein
VNFCRLIATTDSRASSTAKRPRCLADHLLGGGMRPRRERLRRLKLSSPVQEFEPALHLIFLGTKCEIKSRISAATERLLRRGIVALNGILKRGLR